MALKRPHSKAEAGRGWLEIGRAILNPVILNEVKDLLFGRFFADAQNDEENARVTGTMVRIPAFQPGSIGFVE
ncbi:MAG TPA: hypothetical protein VFS96_06330 [Nitrolancea sp.]|nr:hypothetical protein [Nitrolancea sp.]